MIANAYCAFVQLVRRGKQAVAYPTPLAQFAIRQVRAGRRVGCRLNVRDILSSHIRRTHQLTIQRLNHGDQQSGLWTELLMEDRQAGPAEIAAARLDLAAWFRKMSVRNRKIARELAMGARTADVARQFSLTPGRVSQLRSWFRANWAQFQNGNPTEDMRPSRSFHAS